MNALSLGKQCLQKSTWPRWSQPKVFPACLFFSYWYPITRGTLGKLCMCSTEPPAESGRVDDDLCSTPCPGDGSETCSGNSKNVVMQAKTGVPKSNLSLRLSYIRTYFIRRQGGGIGG